jgi:hypothetical protein
MSLRSKAASDAPPQDEEKVTIRGREEQAESSVAPTLTAEQETKLWRKIDLRLIPIIATMYLLSFMDRGVYDHSLRFRAHFISDVQAILVRTHMHLPSMMT